MGGDPIGEVGLSAPVPYPSYCSPGGDVVRRAKGIGVDVTIGLVALRFDKLKDGMPGGILGTTGTYISEGREKNTYGRKIFIVFSQNVCRSLLFSHLLQVSSPYFPMRLSGLTSCTNPRQ